MPKRKKFDVNAWFGEFAPKFRSLAETVEPVLRSLLKTNGIKHVSIQTRVKDFESLRAKLKQKNYKTPEKDLTDFAGLRIIVYRESDVARVRELVGAAFQIVDEHTIDKSSELDVQKVGYRSMHCVCECGADRCKFPEYAPFAGLRFEVQIRTVLQHAWAEIEHAHYKNGSSLPNDMKRRLYLAAGLLEVADRELTALSDEIAEKSESVTKEVAKGHLDQPIDAITLESFLRSRFPSIQNSGLGGVLAELSAFGVRTLRELQALLSEDFNAVYTELNLVSRTTIAGLARDAMMFADLRRYLADCWEQHWHIDVFDWDVSGDDADYAFLFAKYGGRDAVEAIMREAGVFDPPADEDPVGAPFDPDPSDYK